MGLFEALQRLSNLKRAGWLLSKVPADLAEDVADHTLKVALIAMEMASRASKRGIEVDVEKVLKMALIHDLAEAYFSDIPKPAEERMDRMVLREIQIRGLKMATEELVVQEDLLRVFEEYLMMDSREAVIVKLADVLSTYLQARSYQVEHGIRTKHLDEIARNCEEEIPRILKMAGLTEEDLRGFK